MENHYKLAIIPDYNKASNGVLILTFFLIVPVLLFALAIHMKWIDTRLINFELIMGCYLFIAILSAYIFAKNSYTIDDVILNTNTIKSKKFGEFKYVKVVKCQPFDKSLVPYCLVKFTNGTVWSLAPAKKYNSKSQEIFKQFLKTFQEKVAAT